MSSGSPVQTPAAHHRAHHCPIESKFSLSLRVMLGIRLMWSSTQLPTQRSISERTAGSLAPESKRSFALSLQCIVHLVRRSWDSKDNMGLDSRRRRGESRTLSYEGLVAKLRKVTVRERISHSTEIDFFKQVSRFQQVEPKCKSNRKSWIQVNLITLQKYLGNW